jgi:hypothetical protein
MQQRAEPPARRFTCHNRHDADGDEPCLFLAVIGGREAVEKVTDIMAAKARERAKFTSNITTPTTMPLWISLFFPFPICPCSPLLFVVDLVHTCSSITPFA